MLFRLSWSRLFARVRLLDFLLGNRDRHATNWLVRPGNYAVAIDHGASRPTRGFEDKEIPQSIFSDAAIVERIKKLELPAFRSAMQPLLLPEISDAIWARIAVLKRKIREQETSAPLRFMIRLWKCGRLLVSHGLGHSPLAQ